MLIGQRKFSLSSGECEDSLAVKLHTHIIQQTMWISNTKLDERNWRGVNFKGVVRCWVLFLARRILTLWVGSLDHPPTLIAGIGRPQKSHSIVFVLMTCALDSSINYVAHHTVKIWGHHLKIHSYSMKQHLTSINQPALWLQVIWPLCGVSFCCVIKLIKILHFFASS